MYNKLLVRAVICASLITGCWVTASGAKIVEKILVIVNDETITKTELDEQLAKAKAEQRQIFQLQGRAYTEEQLSAEVEKLEPTVLEEMIGEVLVIQQAVRLGMQVPDVEVQQYISNLKSQSESDEAFLAAIEAEGYTLDSFRKQITRTLLYKKLIDQEFGLELRVTDEEVRRFYRENRDQFPSKSDTVRLKSIFIRFHTTEDDKEKALRRAENILNQCRNGADFGKMAEDFSDHELTNATGGDMGYFIPGTNTHNPRLEEVASKLSVGEMSNLIDGPGGYDIIKVTAIDGGRVRAQRIHIAVRPDPESERAAEVKANSISEELANGADFVDLVKMYSDDPMAGDANGDWGEVSIDEMAPSLRGAFDLFEEGEVSRPVKTPLGLHILKVIERRDLTDDEMKQLRTYLQETRLREKLSDYSGRLREEAYIHRLAED